MNNREFRKAMLQGLGRCYIELSTCEDKEKYRAAVLYGCLHNTAFDTQCEGTRAAYMYRLASCYDEIDSFAQPACRRFMSVSGRDTWEFQHLCELTDMFAENSCQTAVDAMHEKYRELYGRMLKRHRVSGYDYIRDNFEYILTRLALWNPKEDFDAYLADLGKLLHTNKHYTASDFEIFAMYAEELLGKTRLIKRIKTASRQFPELSALADECEKLHRISCGQDTVLPPTADELVRTLDESGSIPVFLALRMAREGEPEETKHLTAIIEAETDPVRKAALLRPFYRLNYPGSHAALIEYSTSECEVLREAAINALLKCKSETVYRYAKGRLDGGDGSADAICMLLMNYRPADKRLLLDALLKLKADRNDESHWHMVCLTIVGAQDHGVCLPKEFFEYIYENSLCSCCRESALRHLSKHHWLTPELIEECRYDSNDDITAFVNRYYR